MEVKAPNSYQGTKHPWVFLAGSIEMGTADNWQSRLVAAVPRITFLNPRREDWDSSWEQSIHNDKFREQVEWELQAQEDADIILMHFEPETKSPITLLEFGLFARSDKLVVRCPAGFWRKGNVDIVCKRYGIRQVRELSEFVEYLKELPKKEWILYVRQGNYGPVLDAALVNTGDENIVPAKKEVPG